MKGAWIESHDKNANSYNKRYFVKDCQSPSTGDDWVNQGCSHISPFPFLLFGVAGGLGRQVTRDGVDHSKRGCTSSYHQRIFTAFTLICFHHAHIWITITRLFTWWWLFLQCFLHFTMFQLDTMFLPACSHCHWSLTELAALLTESEVIFLVFTGGRMWYWWHWWVQTLDTPPPTLVLAPPQCHPPRTRGCISWVLHYQPRHPVRGKVRVPPLSSSHSCCNAKHDKLLIIRKV